MPTPPAHHPDALEFVRFCRDRRPVGWPEIYDEMWAVAVGRHFRGLGFEDLEACGIGFSLAAMPSLAVLAREVMAESPRPLRPLRPVRQVRPAASSSRRGVALVDGAARGAHGRGSAATWSPPG